MQRRRWRPALMCIVLAACAGPTSAKEIAPEIALTLEQPKATFVLGQPIALTVLFKNNLKRDVQIEGFCPESGLDISTAVVCSDGAGTGAITTRKVTATTEVGVERLSGESTESDRTVELGPSKGRSFLLKAGGSKNQSFDLMQTVLGAPTIDSPGRFRVSLIFKVRAEASKGYEHARLEWEGEAHAKPIVITVIAGKK